MNATEQDLFRDAIDTARRAYYADVRDYAQDIADRLRSGDIDNDRESLMEDIAQTVDGCSWVIYTARAQMVCIASDNADAWEDYGSDFLGTPSDGLFWSRMAYCALERDVIERIDAEDDIDTNADTPYTLAD